MTDKSAEEQARERAEKIAEALVSANMPTGGAGLLKMDIADVIQDTRTRARREAFEEAAGIAETMDYSIHDAGPEAEGKMLSGSIEIDNRNRETPLRIATALRAKAGE